MAFRFFKSFGLGKFLRLNLGKKGVSLSIGPRGASVNVGRNGARARVSTGIPGLSYEQRLSGKQAANCEARPYGPHRFKRQQLERMYIEALQKIEALGG